MDEPVPWRRSTRCESNNCMEVAVSGNVVKVRNSQCPDVEPTLMRESWRCFVAELKGERRGE